MPAATVKGEAAKKTRKTRRGRRKKSEGKEEEDKKEKESATQPAAAPRPRRRRRRNQQPSRKKRLETAVLPGDGLLVICECPGSRRYGPIFKRLLGGALRETVIVRCSPDPDDLGAMREQLGGNDSPLFVRMTAMCITGSSASAYDKEPWIAELKDIIRRACASPDVKHLVGICFGHQIIAGAMGHAVVKNSNGHEGGVARFGLSEKGRACLRELAPHSMPPPEKDGSSLYLHCWHGDCVTLAEHSSVFELG